MRRLKLALCAIALLCALALGARGHANATAAELVSAAGAPLLAYARSTQDEGVRALYLNGARLGMRTGSTLDTSNAVLDAYESRCRARLAKQNGARLPHGFDGIARFGTDAQGFVGCIDFGTDVTASDLLTRLEQLVATGDVEELGKLEVVWAMRSERGARYVALWSEGSLPLWKMFPGTGDAPGIDLPDAPRPPQSRRLLSLWQQGEAPMIASYASALAPDVLLARYREALSRAGFEVRASDDGQASGVLQASRTSADDRQSALLVVVGADDENGSLISVMR